MYGLKTTAAEVTQALFIVMGRRSLCAPRLLHIPGIKRNLEESLPQSVYMHPVAATLVLPHYQRHLTSSSTDRRLLLRYAVCDRFP